MATRFLPLVEPAAIERRLFLAGCAAVAGTAACSGATTTSIEDDAGGDDAAMAGEGSTGDGAGPLDAGSGQSTCPATAKDTGKMPSAFAVGAPLYVPSANAFVVRDAMGLYALTAVCTHQGCAIGAAGGGFLCPCHGARFDLNGAVTAGPARSPLRHYALCVSMSGNVAIDTSTVVPASTRSSF